MRVWLLGVFSDFMEQLIIAVQNIVVRKHLCKLHHLQGVEAAEMSVGVGGDDEQLLALLRGLLVLVLLDLLKESSTNFVLK